MSETTASAKVMGNEKAETKSRSESKSGKEQAASLNMDELRELADLVDGYGFTDFEFENENIRVRLSKMTAAPIVQTAPAYAPAAAAQPAASQGEPATEVPVDEDADLFKIVSPIVGTFYRSPGPDKDPYVKEGSTVKPDSVVCIVEAMKLMNEIQAEASGEVVKIYVENGQPVEYGQPLFGIRK